MELLAVHLAKAGPLQVLNEVLMTPEANCFLNIFEF